MRQAKGWWTVYQIGKAIVRVHGEVSRERLEVAVERFVRGVEDKKRKEANKKSKNADGEVETRPQGLACG